MSNDAEPAPESRRLETRVRALCALSLLAAVLAVLVFRPYRTRLPLVAAPLHAPIAVDEPVVHLWK